LRGKIRTIADQAVDAPAEQPHHVGRLVDGPDVHVEAGSMRRANEPRRDDARPAGGLGHLEALVRRVARRQAEPRPVQEPPDLLARGARARLWLGLAGGAQHRRRVPAEPDAIERAGPAHLCDGTDADLGVVALQLDDDWNAGVACEYLGQARDAVATAHVALAVDPAEVEGRVELRQHVGAVLVHVPHAVGRTLERRVVMHHHDAVARQAHVELEAVGPDEQAVVEGEEGILGPQGRPAAMRERQKHT